MPLHEGYLIPPTYGPHILFTNPPSPKQYQHSRSPLSDYNYHPHQALLLPAPYDIMSKHVRWGNDVPRTPSPALSTGSQHSSVGPSTPPSAHTSLPQVAGYYPPHQYSTYLTPAAPFLTSQPLPSSPAMSSSSSSSGGSPLGLVLNDVLSSSLHGRSSTRPFEWNLLEDPVKVLGSGSRQYIIPPERFAEPATSPPKAELKIICESLAWTIIIQPSPHYGNIFVTVGDVLQKLYQQLRRSVSAWELDNMCRARPDLREPIMRACEVRVQMSPRRREEEGKGVRRVDCLMGTSKFGGFKVVRDKPDSAELSLMLKLR